jgi:putative FmdB family regulatory protein
MPIYEYRCSACGHELEVLQKFSEPPLTACPACGKSALTKLMSASGFQLKGSGWYATDFKSSGAKPAAKSDTSKEGGSKGADAKGESKAADGKAESKGETKSAGSTETASAPSPSKPAPATDAVK